MAYFSSHAAPGRRVKVRRSSQAPTVTATSPQPTTSSLGGSWGGVGVGHGDGNSLHEQQQQSENWLPHGNTPTPVDPMLEAAKASGARQVSLADARAGYDRGRLARDYGYLADGSIDPSNPYSQAALWQQRYQENKRGNVTSLAAQGQLYSGAMQNAQDATTRDYYIGDHQLRNQFSDAMANVDFAQAGTYASVLGGVSAEAFQALLDRLKPPKG